MKSEKLAEALRGLRERGLLPRFVIDEVRSLQRHHISVSFLNTNVGGYSCFPHSWPLAERASKAQVARACWNTLRHGASRRRCAH